MKQLKKGMVLGYSEFDTPEDAYTFALNIQKSSQHIEGELTDEGSNSLVVTLPEGYELLGTVNLLNDELVLFLLNTVTNHFVIAKQVRDQYVQLVNIAQSSLSDAFNYTMKYPIKGEYRVVNGCKNIVYWYNGNQPDRFIRLDDLDYHKDDLGNWVASSFLLKPEYDYQPSIFMAGLIESGGNLPISSYSISARYLDDMYNPTDWFGETQPYPITNLGSFNSPDTIEGNDTNTPTNNGLLFNIINLDFRYKYIEVAVHKYTNEFTVESFSYNIYEITDKTKNEMTVSITSVANLNKITYQETVVPTAKYENSKAMIQYDNRLIRANLTEKVYDWGKFQEKANEIVIRYRINEVPVEDSNLIQNNPLNNAPSINYINGTKSPYAYENKSMMRDEVYALGIIWTFKDGSESPVFHIPGRLADVNLPTNTDPDVHNRPLPTGAWDTSEYAIVSYPEDLAIYDEITSGGDVERWQAWNTATRLNTQLGHVLAYYECRDLDNQPILYPDVRGCDGVPIYPNIQDPISLEYTMLPIRHHRMPDTTLEPIVSQNGLLLYYLYLVAKNVQVPNGYDYEVRNWRIVISDRSNDKTIIDKGIINSVYNKLYQYETSGTVTANESDVRTLSTQSIQFSWDNQSPKSYSIQSSDTSFSKSFVGLPACSDTLSYRNELAEEILVRTTEVDPYFVSYHSPLNKIQKTELKGTHIKYEREIYTTLDFVGHFQPSGSLNALFTNSNEDFHVENNRRRFKNRETKNIITTNVYQKYYKSGVPYDSLTNRKINATSYLEADSTYNNTIINSFNNKTQQETLLLKLDDYSVGAWIDDVDCSYENMFAIAPNNAWWHIPGDHTRACNWLAGQTEYNRGGIMSYNYVAIKQLKTDCYYQLDKIKYINVSNLNYVNGDGIDQGEMYGGDIFLTRMAFRKTFYNYIPHGQEFATVLTLYAINKNGVGNSEDLFDQNTWPPNVEINSVWESLIIDTWYESEINIEFREHGEAVWNNNNFNDTQNPSSTSDIPANANVKYQLYFPKYYGEFGKELLMLEPNANAISRLKDSGEWKFYQLFPNYYKLNEIYSIKYPNNRYFPLNRKYDWCDECTGEFKNRIIWSDKSYSEDIEDTYRRYLVNNYIDIIASSGQVTELLEQQQKIYVNTEHSMYLLPQTNATIQLTEGTANIGTGEFFSIPAIRLSNATYSYAGNQGRFNKLITEYGTLFINQEQKKVYLFQESLEDIGQSIQIYLNNNLKSLFNEVYKDTMLVDYQYLDNHTYDAGLGLITTFDYTNKRFIIHKKDFLPLYALNDEIRDTLYFNESTQSWYWTDHDLEDVPAPFTNQQFWENKSFTLSYDITSKTWLSFHSYQPNIFYYNNETFYSSYNLNELYKHTNKATKRTFYEVTYPSMIEYISYANPKAIKADNINYLLKVQQSNINLTDTSFSSAIMYNSYQSSGEFDIIFRSNPYDTRLWSNTEKYVSVLDNIHRVTGIKDMVYLNSAPISTNNWSDIQSYYDINGQGYIDKIPNSTVLDFTKNLYNTSQFKDQYQRVRLIFDDNSGKSFRLQLLDNNTTQSFR